MAGETILLHTFYRQTRAILTCPPHAKYYEVMEVTQVAIKKNKIKAKKNSHCSRNIKKSFDAHARFDDHRKLKKNVNKIRLPNDTTQNRTTSRRHSRRTTNQSRPPHKTHATTTQKSKSTQNFTSKEKNIQRNIY